MQYRIFVLLGCNSVAGNVVRDVSKEPFAYILMYLESLKTKATRSFETSINPYSSTQGHITKAVNLRETSSCGYIYETLHYVTSGRIPEIRVIQFTVVPHAILYFQQAAGRPFSCALDAEE